MCNVRFTCMCTTLSDAQTSHCRLLCVCARALFPQICGKFIPIYRLALYLSYFLFISVFLRALMLHLPLSGRVCVFVFICIRCNPTYILLSMFVINSECLNHIQVHISAIYLKYCVVHLFCSFCRVLISRILYGDKKEDSLMKACFVLHFKLVSVKMWFQ